MTASQFPPLQSKPSSKHCTNCSAKMTLYSLPGHYASTVEIDVCLACNAIWFDQYESSQLSPDGTVALFQLIHERGGTATSASTKFGEGLRCVTCGDGMQLTHDQVKGMRFTYQACRRGHGRLTTFYNFLAEKQFVRELTHAERATLAATVQQVRCSGCGAAVNIGKVDACEYCRAPVSVFDRDAAKQAIDHYLQERQQQPAVSGGRRDAGYSGQGQWSNLDHADLGSDILYALGRAALRGGSGASRTGAGIASGAGAAGTFGGAAAAADILPDATAVLFGADLTASAAATSLSEGVSSIGNALPSATDALFGTAANAGSGVLESVGESAFSAVSDVASSAGDSVVDLVTDGIGSLLGSLFD